MSGPYTPDNTGEPVLSYTAPDDGDDPDVASVMPMLGGVADDVSRLARGRTIAVYTYAVEDETAPIVLETFADHTGYTTATNAKVDVPNCLVGDTLLVDVAAVAKFDGTLANHYGKIRLKQTDDVSGTPAFTTVTGALVWFDSSLANSAEKFSLTHALTVVEAGTTRVGLQGIVTNSGDTLTLEVACVIRVQHMRYT